MTGENNKTTVRNFFEAFGKNDQSVLRELVASEYQAHAPGMPSPVNKETLVQRIGILNAAFSDLRVNVEDQIAERDKVVTHLSWQGTHTGDSLGFPPTGAAIVVTLISIERLIEGKIVERWFIQDDMGMMKQLGVI